MDETRPSHLATRSALALGALSAWSIGLPYIGDALGLDVNVPATLEIIDHVIPGAIAAVCAGYAYMSLRRGSPATSIGYLLAVGVSLLAGLWITTTHIPLLLAAARGTVDWASALWHSLPGLPMPVLSAVLFVVSPEETRTSG